MAEQNLHDIKIDDLDNNNKSKKTPLKNILTLLALLFIILVISVVITRLILSTDDDAENNTSVVATSSTEANGTGINATHAMTAAGAVAAGAAIATLSSDKKESTQSTTSSSETTESKNNEDTKKEEIKKNNSGSKINVKLTDRQAPKKIQPLITPAKKKTPTKRVVTHVKKRVTSSPKKHVKYVKKTVKHHKDRVVAKRTSSSKKSKSTGHYVTKLSRGYHIKVGAFSDISNAVNSIKKTHLNYELIKIKNGKNMTRVLVGPFKTNKSAEIQLRKIKKIASGAYIIRVK